MFKSCNNDVLRLIVSKLNFQDRLSLMKTCTTFDRLIGKSNTFHVMDDPTTKQVRNRPECYIGSVESELTSFRGLNQDKIETIQADVTEGVWILFRDMIEFVFDTRSPDTNIVVTIQDNCVTIQYDSKLSLTSKLDPYTADIELMTNGNYIVYLENKAKSGLNSLRLANIFSASFSVNMYDYEKNVHYLQKWEGDKCYSPVIERGHLNCDTTKPLNTIKPLNTPQTGSRMIISYELDPNLIQLGDKHITLTRFEAHLCDQAMIHKVDIITHFKYEDWNHNSFGSLDLKQYATKYYNINTTDCIHTKLGLNPRHENRRNNYTFDDKFTVDQDYVAEVLICYPTVALIGEFLGEEFEDVRIRTNCRALAHGKGIQGTVISFVNNQHTRLGGNHVTAVRRAINRFFKEMKGASNRSTMDRMKNSHIFVSVKIPCVLYAGQTKNYLSSAIKFQISKQILEPMLDW